MASFCISSLEPLQVQNVVSCQDLWVVGCFPGLLKCSGWENSGERSNRTSTARCRPHGRCGTSGRGWSCTRGYSKLSSLSSWPCPRRRNRCRRRNLAVPDLSASSLSLAARSGTRLSWSSHPPVPPAPSNGWEAVSPCSRLRRPLRRPLAQPPAHPLRGVARAGRKWATALGREGLVEG